MLDQSRLTIVPCTLEEANTFVERLHRHHRPVVGARFCLAVADEESVIRGVAIVGRPVARNLDLGWTAEVTRLCTDGCPNACSSLYSACWRAAKAMGYRRLITYILEDEPGTSLRAAGWRLDGISLGRSWNHPSRWSGLVDYPIQGKQRWLIGQPIDPAEGKRPRIKTREDAILSLFPEEV